MRILTFALVLFAASPLACGADEEQQAADKLEADCKEFCQAMGSCGVEGFDANQCSTACGYLDQQLGGMCIEEYSATLQCTVDGGIMCTENGPVPNELCLEENQAMLTCTQASNCQRFCEQAESAGCAPGGSVAACATSCNDTRTDLGLACGSRYDLYLQCSTSFSDLGCSDGKPSSPTCDEDLLGVGDCLTNESPCKGYCFNAGVLGCQDAAACEASCNTTRDANPTCSENYDDWLECVAEDDTASCNGEALDASGCDFDRESYDMCLAAG